MSQARAENTMLHAYTCEDILKATQDGKLFWSVLDREATPWEHKWYLKYRPWAMKIAALMMAFMSLLSFIGVCCCMSGADNKSSIYYQVVHDPSSTPGGIVIFIFLTLGYTVYVTSWALFQMNFAGLMILIRYSTTPESLSFNVRMIARLAAPLAFFYLGWISEAGLRSGSWTTNMAESHYMYVNTTTNVTLSSGAQVLQSSVSLVAVPGGVTMMSSFSRFYSLGDIPVVRQSFGTIFPVLLIVILSLSITSLYNRICVYAHMQKWQFGMPIVDEETLNRGKKELKRKKAEVMRRAQNANFAQHIRAFGKKKFDSEGDGDNKGGGFFGFKNRKKGATALPELEIHEPEPLAGTVEKKCKSSIGFGTSWKPL